MELSLSDWIYHSPGQLRAGVFLSRCLLYRMNECNCSLLVYHEPSASASFIGDSKSRMSYKITVPKTLHLHFVPDRNASLDRLKAEEPIHLPLSREVSITHSIGNLRVMIEPHNLYGRGMIDFGWERDRKFEYPIENTAYYIQTPVSLIALGKQAPAENGQLHCWKVMLESDKRRYDLSCPGDWSLSVFDLEDHSDPTLVLFCKAGQ